jgi:hypothetical protein
MYTIQNLEGRPHFVVPTVLITVGTHAGSMGPVYYAPDSLRNSVRLWNGKPVVVYHPEMYSGGYADHPDVFNHQKVGVLFNARFDGKRLLADAWIDAERVRSVDARVLNAILARQVMEVSTGMTVEHEHPTANMADGSPVVAVNLLPDHLAILPDKVGACSVAAGAGLMRNEPGAWALAY